ncbi:MAG: crosslink repair DNA glycosylase YcaQ family protein, partial [Myxococcota bacterium]
MSGWFAQSFRAPTAVQTRGWDPIGAGRNTLLLAPTGSGKTLAAFLAVLDRLVRLPLDAPPGVRVLYVSPLKALVYDIERNLRAPLVGIANAASRLGRSIRPIRVDIRTGDTSARDRRLQAKEPGEILVTTPESLYLLLGSAARDTLRSIDAVIVDEIHVMAGAKRGVHLALSLERLTALTDRDPQRIGLSATQRPLEEIARFLGGDRPVEIVDASGPPRLDLKIVVPVDDMEHPVISPSTSGATTVGGGGEGPFQRVGGGRPDDASGPDRMTAGMWPVIYPELLALIRARRSTIVFANSRLLCERLARRLNELAGEDLVLAHHGSLSHERRAEIEEALKAGRLPALIATSSLELGIDMGAVDQVVLVESPGSVASGLQRVGRSGHSVGQTSIGRIFPKFRGDLVEAAVVAREMATASVESTRIPRNCLDVLAQQCVASIADRDWTVDALFALVRRAYPYRDLTAPVFASVLDMLAGRYPQGPAELVDGFTDLRPRIVWDRATDVLSARKGSRAIALLNGGTIPDRGLYAVHLGPDGPKLGELDEEMVYECRKGDLIVLGASTWRIEEITRDRVVVSPAPGEPGRLPFWHGERPGRTYELGQKVGAFVREIGERGADALAWLPGVTPVDEKAAKNLVAYLRDQREVTGEVPTDRTLVVESFRDELGDWRVCVLSPFGSRVHAPWALALEARFAGHGGFDVQALWTDDGLSLRFADAEELPPLSELYIDPDELEDLVVEQLGKSALFAARFRENAARSLLMPRKSIKGRVPLWAQRLRSQNLLQVASKFPSFPVVLETYRECLQDVLDVPSLREVLTGIRSRTIRVHEVETPSPSPFARSLVFAYVAAFMYAGDAPLAERKAAALTLDRALLRELLGQEELRELLEPVAVAEVEAELQGLTDERRVRSADALHDLLRRLGDLDDAELRARATPGSDDAFADWLRGLEIARRIVPVRIAGVERWIAVEDAGRYRDALGVALPPALPAVFLEVAPDALEWLVARFARTHGPFTPAMVAERFGMPPSPIGSALARLEQAGRVVIGDIRPGGTTVEYCDPEVLRRLKRRSLAVLRNQIAPVEAEVYARFLAQWHGIADDAAPGRSGPGRSGPGRAGLGRLREVIDQLEGLVARAPVDEVKVGGGWTADALAPIARACEELGLPWSVDASFLGPRTASVALTDADGWAVVTFRAGSDGSPERLVKRVVDGVGAVVGLIARGPLILAVLAAVRLAAGGPALSHQR